MQSAADWFKVKQSSGTSNAGSKPKAGTVKKQKQANMPIC
jgi:hypothetical protein